MNKEIITFIKFIYFIFIVEQLIPVFNVDMNNVLIRNNIRKKAQVIYKTKNKYRAEPSQILMLCYYKNKNLLSQL